MYFVKESAILTLHRSKYYPFLDQDNITKNQINNSSNCWNIDLLKIAGMTAQNQNFGLMDQAYFVSRSEVIAWVNDLLKLNISKIEELGSGAVYCQIFDAIYPGKVAMAKVNWKAKVDYEFLNNYKILQAVFDKFGIKKYIEVQKLSKAKYQDNLQFIQWCKRYYEVNGGEKNQPYAAQERRGNVKVDFGYAQKVVVPKSFNGVGQIIPKVKSSSKEKRADSGALGHRENVKRLASPNNLPKAKSPSHQKKINFGTLENKEAKQTAKPSLVHNPPHYPPPPIKKTEQKVQHSEQSSIRPQKGSVEQLQKYKKIVRDLQSKLQMIAQIAQSNDEAEMKMRLIEEVLSIGMNYSKVSEFNENQNKVKQSKYMQTIKSEEVIEQSIHNNESMKQQSSNVHSNSKKQEEKNSHINVQPTLVDDEEVF